MKALYLVKLLKDSSLAMARGLMMDEMLVLTKGFSVVGTDGINSSDKIKLVRRVAK